MPESRLQLKKSAIGASSVTLIPSTTNRDGMNEAAVTQIVVSTPSTPPAHFWGTVTTDGIEYELLLRKS